MSTSTINTAGAVALNYDLPAVQSMVMQGAVNTEKAIIVAIMATVQEQKTTGVRTSPGQMAAKHVNLQLDETTSQMDEVAKRVYAKVFEAAQERLTQPPMGPLIQSMLKAMNAETNQTTMSMLFVGSFVLPEARKVLEQVRETQPAALQDARIWQMAQ